MGPRGRRRHRSGARAEWAAAGSAAGSQFQGATVQRWRKSARRTRCCGGANGGRADGWGWHRRSGAGAPEVSLRRRACGPLQMHIGVPCDPRSSFSRSWWTSRHKIAADVCGIAGRFGGNAAASQRGRLAVFRGLLRSAVYSCAGRGFATRRAAACISPARPATLPTKGLSPPTFAQDTLRTGTGSVKPSTAQGAHLSMPASGQWRQRARRAASGRTSSTASV